MSENKTYWQRAKANAEESLQKQQTKLRLIDLEIGDFKKHLKYLNKSRNGILKMIQVWEDEIRVCESKIDEI